jgi:hypothetical protein
MNMSDQTVYSANQEPEKSVLSQDWKILFGTKTNTKTSGKVNIETTERIFKACQKVHSLSVLSRNKGEATQIKLNVTMFRRALIGLVLIVLSCS